MELREADGHLGAVVVGLEEQLVAPGPRAGRLEDGVEVERGHGVAAEILRRDVHLAAAQLRRARVRQRPQVGIAAEHRRGSERAYGRSGGVQTRRSAGRQASDERSEVRKPVAVHVELLVRDAAVAVLVQRQRLAGEVGSIVDQGLAQAVPAAHLVAVVVVVHAAELQLQAARHVDVERRLQQHVLGVGVLVVAARIFRLRVQPIAESLAANAPRAAHFRGEHQAVPRSEIQPKCGDGVVDELAGLLDARGFRAEVQIAADLGRAVDGRGRPAHDVHPRRGADGRRIVAGIVQPAHAAKVGLAAGAANVQCASHAEERLREGPGREGDEFVDVAHVEPRQHLVAHRGGGARRFEQRLLEPRQRRHAFARQAGQVRTHDHRLHGLAGVARGGTGIAGIFGGVQGGGARPPEQRQWQSLRNPPSGAASASETADVEGLETARTPLEPDLAALGSTLHAPNIHLAPPSQESRGGAQAGRRCFRMSSSSAKSSA